MSNTASLEILLLKSSIFFIFIFMFQHFLKKIILRTHADRFAYFFCGPTYFLLNILPKYIIRYIHYFKIIIPSVTI